MRRRFSFMVANGLNVVVLHEPGLCKIVFPAEFLGGRSHGANMFELYEQIDRDGLQFHGRYAVDPNSSRQGGAYQLGTLSQLQTMLRLNGYNNKDLSIIKNTPIAENADLQLKLKMPNVFNRHAFGTPSTTPMDTPSVYRQIH